MKDANQSLYDLTAQEAAWVGSPHARLFIEAMRAVHKKELQAQFDGELSTGVPYAGQLSLSDLARKAIFALEQNPNFYVRWFRMISVDPSHYRRWRDQKPDRAVTGETQQQPRSSPKKVQTAVSEFVSKESKAGRNVSQKRLWDWAKAAIPGATFRQAVEAMAKAEGGKKPRGRPRKSPRQAS